MTEPSKDDLNERLDRIDMRENESGMFAQWVKQLDVTKSVISDAHSITVTVDGEMDISIVHEHWDVNVVAAREQEDGTIAVLFDLN